MRDAIAQNDLRYPVVQDNDYAVWEAYQNQYWPASYFLDGEGRVRYVHFGEGGYAEKEDVIRELLQEEGRRPGARAGGRGPTASPGVTTPENYWGPLRARAVRQRADPGRDTGVRAAPRAAPDQLGYGGRWRIGDEAATALANARLELDSGPDALPGARLARTGAENGARAARRPADRRAPGGRDVQAGRVTSSASASTSWSTSPAPSATG